MKIGESVEMTYVFDDDVKNIFDELQLRHFTILPVPRTPAVQVHAVEKPTPSSLSDFVVHLGRGQRQKEAELEVVSEEGEEELGGAGSPKVQKITTLVKAKLLKLQIQSKPDREKLEFPVERKTRLAFLESLNPTERQFLCSDDPHFWVQLSPVIFGKMETELRGVNARLSRIKAVIMEVCDELEVDPSKWGEFLLQEGNNQVPWKNYFDRKGLTRNSEPLMDFVEDLKDPEFSRLAESYLKGGSLPDERKFADERIERLSRLFESQPAAFFDTEGRESHDGSSEDLSDDDLQEALAALQEANPSAALAYLRDRGLKE